MFLIFNVVMLRLDLILFEEIKNVIMTFYYVVFD